VVSTVRSRRVVYTLNGQVGRIGRYKDMEAKGLVEAQQTESPPGTGLISFSQGAGKSLGMSKSIRKLYY
jgi:hypothetical protein